MYQRPWPLLRVPSTNGDVNLYLDFSVIWSFWSSVLRFDLYFTLLFDLRHSRSTLGTLVYPWVFLFDLTWQKMELVCPLGVFVGHGKWRLDTQRPSPESVLFPIGCRRPPRRRYGPSGATGSVGWPTEGRRWKVQKRDVGWRLPPSTLKTLYINIELIQWCEILVLLLVFSPVTPV